MFGEINGHLLNTQIEDKSAELKTVDAESKGELIAEINSLIDSEKSVKAEIEATEMLAQREAQLSKPNKRKTAAADLEASSIKTKDNVYDDPKLVLDIVSYLCDLWIKMVEEVASKIDFDLAGFWEELSSRAMPFMTECPG